MITVDTMLELFVRIAEHLHFRKTRHFKETRAASFFPMANTTDLYRLRYFMGVVDQGTVAAAARKLNTTTSTISDRMKELEDVGARLFMRSKNKLVLTKAGKVFAEEIRFILQRYDRACKRARSHEAGSKLLVGFNPSPTAEFRELAITEFAKSL